MRSKNAVLFVFLILSLCWCHASYAASGSVSDPCLISSASDLASLRDRVNAGTETKGLYYKLTKNVSLAKSYTDWEAIGTSSYPFTGHFDGNGCTITVNIDRKGKEAALFGSINTTNNYAVKNLNVKGTVKARMVGGIALDMYSGSIEGCSFTGTLEGATVYSFFGVEYGEEEAHAGGIIKFLHSGTIKNCTVKDTTIDIAPANGDNIIAYVGGIAGKIFAGSISDCLVENVTITGTTKGDYGTWGITTKAGGIVGGFEGGVVSDNEAYTTITGEAEHLYIGGIIGEIEEEGTIENNRYGGPGFGIGCDYEEGIATDNPGCIKVRGGTIEDPILIESTADLITLRDQIKNKKTFTGDTYYRLETDLILSGWEPMGTDDNPFTGHFDGNGHTINLTIAERWDGAALFGTIKTDSDYAVKNLTVNANLKGRFVAGIALNLYSGSIDDCTVSGTLNGTTTYEPDYGTFSSYTGGIVEHMYGGSINRCTISNALVITKPWCTVESEGGAAYVGGIVARMENGSVTDCVTDESSIVAGICQYIRDFGALAGIRVGGIVGSISSGTISNNTSNAEVHGWGDNVRIGRILGELKNATKIQNNKYVCNGVSVTQINGDYVGDLDKTFMPRYGIGYNKSGIATDDPGCENIGAGSSESNPVMIRTVDELQALSDIANSGSDTTGLYYRLDADLSIAAWAVIGTDDDTPFKGHFDGNGHTIEINTRGGATTIASLFGSINTKEGYAVKNLNVKGVLQGHFAGGIVINLINGSIENCSFSGTLVAYAPFDDSSYPDAVSVYWKSTYAGGIATEVTGGTIKNCTVTDSHIVSNPYYAGAMGYAGGITAKMTSGKIENCVVSSGNMIYGISQHQMNAYAFDMHSGIIYAGGIVGLYSGGEIKNNEAYAEVHGWTDSGCSIGGVIGEMEGTVTSSIENNKYASTLTSIALDGDDERNPVPFIPVEITRTLITDRCRRSRIQGNPEDTLTATLGIGKNTNGIASDEPGCINTNPVSGLRISAENFPDTAFCDYVRKVIDTDGNGYLSDEEIAAVKTIDVENRGVTSLKGIELFFNLEVLNCHGNMITNLDVSSNTQLTRLDCASNKLQALDVSKNKALENLECGDNLLTELSLINNAELVCLDCMNNKLMTLDVSHNTNLVTLYCGDNLLTELVLGDNEALSELSCENNQLERLDIKGCPNLAKDDINCDAGVDIITGNDTDTPGIDIPSTVMPEFKEVSIVLSGLIGVNFTMYLPGGIDYSDESKYYMEFAVKEGAANPIQACPTNMIDLEDGRKSAKFTCYINVAQMAEDITPTFHFDGVAITKPRPVSVKLYLNTVIGMNFPKTTKDLMYALMDYGHYSQLMLSKENGWKINEKYAGMPCANEYNSDDINEAKESVAPYAFSSYKNSTGISGMSFSLSLASATTLKLTLDMASTYNAVPSATIDGVKCNDENMKKSGSSYIVAIEGIPAHELNKFYTIMIDANGTNMFKTSALSYAQYILNSKAKSIGKVDIDTMRKAAVALYRYYDAAMAYAKTNR